MVNKADSNKARLHRHKRVRGKISGTADRPRLNVFRSNKNIYAQIIDDVAGVTLCSCLHPGYRIRQVTAVTKKPRIRLAN